MFVEQAETLAGYGIRCSVIVSEIEDSLRNLLPCNVDVFVLGNPCQFYDHAFLPKLLKFSLLLRRLQPDFVIAHQSLSDYLYWALKGTGIPYFLLKYESNFYMINDTSKYSILYRKSFRQIRSSMLSYRESIPETWRPGPLRRLVNEYFSIRDWLGVRGATGVFTLTSQSQWELKQLYNVTSITWIPGSRSASNFRSGDDVDVAALRERHGIQRNEYVILSVNRLEARKRIHVLIDAFRLLLLDGIEARLIVVGEGEEAERLEWQVRGAEVEESVVFTGFVSDEQLPSYYNLCDVAVAIMWGSWGLSIVEPLLYNKKLLISDELSDVLPGVPNLLRVNPEPESVCQGLRESISSPAVNSAEEVSERFNWDTRMDELLGHIGSLEGDMPRRAAS